MPIVAPSMLPEAHVLKHDHTCFFLQCDLFMLLAYDFVPVCSWIAMRSTRQ